MSSATPGPDAPHEHPSSTAASTRAVSWVTATWIVPVAPALWFLAFLLVGGVSDVADDETGGYSAGLALAVAMALTGAVLSRIGGAGVRGAGLGLLAGGLACALPSVWVLLG